MPNDYRGDPWRGATYRGFAGAPAPPRTMSQPARRSRPSRLLLIGGVAAALGLGLLLGFVSQPRLAVGPNAPSSAPPTPPAAPAASVEIAPPAAAGIPIAIPPEPPPPEVPKTSPRLQVLPRTTAPPARNVAPPTPTQPLEAPKSSSVAALAVTPPASAPASALLAPRPLASPAPRADPDCADARSRAEWMVCSDPELAAADREMTRAYRRAIDAGAPATDLRQEQEDWLGVREDAARHSRHAVASVYDQRLRELDDIAAQFEDGTEEDDGDQ